MRSPKQTTRKATTNVKMLHAGEHQGDDADGGQSKSQLAVHKAIDT